MPPDKHGRGVGSGGTADLGLRAELCTRVLGPLKKTPKTCSQSGVETVQEITHVHVLIFPMESNEKLQFPNPISDFPSEKKLSFPPSAVLRI